MFYIPQTSQNDCGYACLKMILAEIHSDNNYLYLPCKEKNKPYSYQELVEIAKKYNTYLVGFKVEEKIEIIKNTFYPLIVSLKGKNGVGHAVIVQKINKRNVKIKDPEKGVYSLSISRFIALWDGTGLLVERSEHFSCPFVYKEVFKKRNYVIGIILQVLSMACCILGVNFIGNTIPIFIPIVFFSLFIIFEILSKGNIFLTMKKIDDKYFDKLQLKKRDYKEFHVRYEDYKKSSLVTPLNAFFTFFTIAFLIFIVVLNGVRNLSMVIFPICIAIVEYFYLNPYIKNKEQDISLDEQQLYDSEDIECYREKERIIHDESYKLGKTILMKKYLAIVIMLLGTILVMALNRIFTITYVVFYLCLEYTIYTNMMDLMSYTDKRKEMQRAKVKLNNILHQKDEFL